MAIGHLRVDAPGLMRLVDQLILKMQFSFAMPAPKMRPMNRVVPCVLMRAGTSRGPFFLRDWLPADDTARDEALIGAIGASDLLQVDGVGGGSTLTSKVAIVSKSSQPDCDVDYLFAQVGVGDKSVDTRPNCGNMLSGVAPFAIEQGLVTAKDGETTVRVFNVNTRSRIDVTVLTPGRRVTYAGGHRGADPPGLPRRLGLGHRLAVPHRPANRSHRRRGCHLHRRGDAAGHRPGTRLGPARPRDTGRARRQPRLA
jgi:hypothetical protein